MTKQGWQTGERSRTYTCKRCGQEHRRRSKEARECRDRYRRGKAPLPAAATDAPSGQRRAGSEITHYLTDPLRGDKRAHAIAKRLRMGIPPRKVAKELGLPYAAVKDVIAKLEGGQ